MTSVPIAFSEILALVWIGLGVYVAWKFYRALARIGEELAEIKTLLRDTRPTLPS